MDKKNRGKKLFLEFGLFAVLWLIFLFIAKLESLNYFTGVDTRIENVFVYFRFAKAVDFFQTITFFGKLEFIYPLTIIICLLLWRYKKFKYIPSFILTAGGAQLCNFILKSILQKPRPMFSLVSETSYSFPSGHAVLAVAFYGLIVYFAYKNLKSRVLKVLVYFAGVIFIFLIGFSRIYLSAHFYSDVLAGWILGGTWLILGILLFKSIAFKTINKLVVLILSVFVIIVSSLFFLTLPTPKVIVSFKTVVVKNALSEFNRENLPRFTEKLSGAHQQPLSFFIVAKNDNELINTFAQAGWVLSEQFSLSTTLKLAETAVENKPYPRGPITPSLWEYQVQSFSFAKPTSENTIRQRHHCRFWKTNIRTTEGKTLYVGTATYDSGIKKWLVTHKVDANIDKEREFLFKDLLKTGEVEKSEKINSVGSVKGTNFQGDYFYTDGKAYVIYFK